MGSDGYGALNDGELPVLISERTAARAREAFALEVVIKTACSEIRSRWVTLAEALYAFRALEGWKALGYMKLGEWLADPQIELSRSQFFHLTSAWGELVIEQGVPVADLSRVDMSKTQTILPAIRRGKISATEAMSDAEHLATHDLRDKYRELAPTMPRGTPDGEGSDWMWDRCLSCGSRIKVLLG